jgi:hypothetical protein
MKENIVELPALILTFSPRRRNSDWMAQVVRKVECFSPAVGGSLRKQHIKGVACYSSEQPWDGNKGKAVCAPTPPPTALHDASVVSRGVVGLGHLFESDEWRVMRKHKTE